MSSTMDPNELLGNASSGQAGIRESLREVRSFIRCGVSIEQYARAIVENDLSATVIEALAKLNASEADMGVLARADLLSTFLEDGVREPLWHRSRTAQRAVLGQMYRRLPYYQTRIPEKRTLRPRRVRIESPVRVDLGMGGLSDLPPWTNEQRGCAVSMCISFDSTPPIYCEAEIRDELGLWLNAKGRSGLEKLTSWEELDDVEAPTAVLRACMRHLLGDSFRHAALDASVAAVFGGGLFIGIGSTAPKGLGSSTIIAACVTQALIRLLGREPEWQDIVHRTVGIERLVGVGGGWEDALPPFFGGIVRAESTPARLPVLKANSLNVSARGRDQLRRNLVLFDTELDGYTGDILAEGTMRYIAGDPDTMTASRELTQACDNVASAVEKEDIAALGSLLSQQWKLWKRITGDACSTPKLEALLAGAQEIVLGAKPNGAGVGGAVLFAVEEGRRAELLEYLDTQPGQVLHWHHDTLGYRAKEWFEAGVSANYTSEKLPERFQANSRFESHGALVACECWPINAAATEKLVGPVDRDLFDLAFEASLAVATIGAAVAPMIGTATPSTLKSKKQIIDATAGAVFDDELKRWPREVSVATAESKDEFGEWQAGSPATGRRDSRIRVAVDVIDGTTLAVTGGAGAYSICAIADNLHEFPDLQAYAILAPASTLRFLDLRGTPEGTAVRNVSAIAEALGKPVSQLKIVSHSSDTGQHHLALIERLREAGAQVIVPEPVIVEPPFVAAACLARTVDAMIGVFGLPEIAINTILAGVLARDAQFAFRIASNRPLQDRDSRTLDGIFDLSEDELVLLQRYGLDSETIYTYETISSGGGIFAGAALTNDEVLDIPGVAHDGEITTVHGWLADPCGNAHGFRVRFQRPADIDYTAKYKQPLFDISLVAPLDSAEAGLLVADRMEELTRELRHNVPGIYIQPRSDTRDGRVGLHITLCEFIVEYFSNRRNDEAGKLMQKATEIIAEVINTFRGPMRFLVDRVEVTRTGVRAVMFPDTAVRLLIQQIIAIGGVAFPELRETAEYHVTLARFREVPVTDVVRRIERLCRNFNQASWPEVVLRKALLHRATATPFRDVADEVAFFVAD